MCPSHACATNRSTLRISTLSLLIAVSIVHFLFTSDANAQSAGVEQDREALVALYEATDGPNWRYNTNWLSDAPLGDWYGVNTDRAGRVVSVYLKGTPGGFFRGKTTHGLTGQLPTELGNLSYLTTLILGINDINGSIPKELGDLSRLTQLNLEDNDLTGSIPKELGGLASLTTLRIQNNQLTGPIPSEIGNLEKLTSIDLSGNQLSGQIPVEFGELTRLTILLLAGNHLIGELPEEFRYLTSLQRLTLDGNNLSGPIPEWIGELKDLTYLSAADNNFSDEIPATIGALRELTELNLEWNFLSGSLPDEINGLTQLETLNLSRNELNGRINPEITKLTNLSILDLSDNNLVGPVLSGFRHMSSLQFLYLRNNNLSGPVPTRFVDAPNIVLFSIDGNQVCVPGTHSFIFWLDSVLAHDIYSLSFCNAADRAMLEHLFEDTSGESWTSSRGWGDEEVALERWHGIDTDALGRVVSIDLGNNGLAGTLPVGLGYLSQLRSLNLEGNLLEGRLPLSLLRLDLRNLHVANTELCVPQELEFQTWLEETVDYVGPNLSCEPLTEREVMTVLFEETRGDSWNDASNWLSDAPLDDWYGVEVGEDGRVTNIEIRANNLSGSIPLELVRLSELEMLNLEANALNGTIPPELGSLTNLTSLDLGFNDLLGAIPTELGELKNLEDLNLSFNRLTGSIPAEIGNLSNLQTLRLAGNALTGVIPAEIGNLSKLSNLGLSFNQIQGKIPPELGNLRELITLELQVNALSGEIPSVLGNLAKLESLWLYFNDFTGSIPLQIGNLADLRVVNLQFNRLGGEIPQELGNLRQLENLYLSYNRFEGSIPEAISGLTMLQELWMDGNRLTGMVPSGLGDLSELSTLLLQDNELTGAIPAELGNLAKLVTLDLSGNDLSGQLPMALRHMTGLERLYLHSNDFAGPIPPEFGALTQLRYLTLSENRGLSGPIPIELTALKQIEVFLTVGTNICLPTDSAFNEWLIKVYQRRIRSCASNGPLLAFLTQSVQSHEFPVPLVANERALLRVFPINTDQVELSIPEAQARFYVDDQEIHVVNIPSRVLAAPTLADPGNLASSANIEIPGPVIRSGLEVEIEVESDAVADSNEDSATPTSTTTRLPAEVHELPDFDLTLIPFVEERSTDRSIVDLVNAMAANPQEHQMFYETRALLPIANLNVTAHEPVVTSSDAAYELLAETTVIRATEGGTGYYMGMKSEVTGTVIGVAYRPGRTSFSLPRSEIIAHELGHNLSLGHAPCGGPFGIDGSFPYANGTVGTWGYDFRGGGSVIRPSTPDLMSYCNPSWISDYHFTNALRYRLFLAHEAERTVATAKPSILVWGGQNPNNELVLNPTFIVHAPPILPESQGEFEISGRNAGGDQLFSMKFDMQIVSDSEMHKSFVFVIPIEPDWEYELDGVALQSRDGTKAVDVGNATSTAILRNPVTRQIRGILRSPRRDVSARIDDIVERASERGLEVLFSHGSPESAIQNP